MLMWRGRERRRAFAAIEAMAVMAVIALLLAMGFMLYRSMRLAARASVAESNLKQISAGLELYFRKYSSYPPQGSDLTVELAPFIGDPDVFKNPLMDESAPGKTINDLYKQPTLSELDSPDKYVTAMIADDGTTAIILKTGSKVDRRDGVCFDPDGPAADVLAVLNPPANPNAAGSNAGSGEESNGNSPAGGDAPAEPSVDDVPNQFTEAQRPGIVTVKDCFDAQFTVVSANLTWGSNGPQVPIVVSGTFARPAAGDQQAPSGTPSLNGNAAVTSELFGGEPVHGGETETRVVRCKESFALGATACYGDWSVTYTSDKDTSQILTLHNGDVPAQFSPYNSPVAIGAALQGMIDPATGTVTIGDNQVLFLFELGTAERGKSSFDLQDLVVLVTLTHPSDASQCEDPPTPPPAENPEPPAADPEPPAPPADEGFDVVDDGEVATKMCSDVRIKAIGSQFGYANGTLVDIVAAANMEQGWFPLYGNKPVKGGEEFSQASVPAGTRIVLKGEIAGSYERWLWTRYGYPLSYTSNDGSGQVLTLVKGSAPVRFKPGFPSQAAVGDLLAPYVDPQTGVVSIADNEALYLWDFNPLRTNYGIDFQDLIILATAVAAERDCEEDGSQPQAPAEPPRPVLALSPINLTTSETSFTVQVTNTATAATDVAANVQLNVQVAAGEQYVDSLSCNSAVGTIAAGQTVNVPVTVNTRASWRTAYDQQIRIVVKILNEDNWPEQNREKAITVAVNGPPRPHPVLAVFPQGDGTNNNRGHGNNTDHDDEDNPGQGGGNHGADPGYDDDGVDDDENGGGCGRTTGRQYTFEVWNKAPAGNPAADVRVAFSIIGGAQYVYQIAYDGDLGTIEPGTSKFVSVRFFPNGRPWQKAGKGTEVTLRVSVVQETSDPGVNVGKSAEVVFER